MPTLADFRSTLRRELPRIRAQYGVRSIGIFGSWVRHEAGPDSDLDLLVDFEHPPNLLRFIELEEDLERSLGVKVDLVSRGALRRRIGERILDEVQTI